MLRAAHEGTGAPPPLDQIGLRELRQRFAHRHARAAVTRDQLVLEWNAMARRPFAGQYTLLDVGTDPLVERRLVVSIANEAHATSLRTDALKRSRAVWRNLCLPPSTTLLPPAQTQSIALLPVAKIQPSMMASRDRPASEGCEASRVTISARAPGAMPTVACASAWAPPATAWSNSVRPVDAPAPPESTLRSRCLSRWPYSSWRNSSVTPTSTLESVPIPKLPPASRNSRPGKMPSPRLASVTGHRPAIAPVLANAPTSSFVMWVA